MAAKSTSLKETVPTKTATKPDEPKMTLSDWCSNRSHKLGRSIEVLSGFQFSERKTLELMTDAEWEAKFQAFLKTPV